MLVYEVADVDGNVEFRAGTISTFKGQPPLVEVHPTEDAEQAAIAARLKARIADGVTPSEMASSSGPSPNSRAVVVAACGDEVIPLPPVSTSPAPARGTGCW